MRFAPRRHLWTLGLCLLPLAAGCEGIDRRHDSRVADVTPPPDDTPSGMRPRVQVASFADLVEEMMATREQYLRQLLELERSYLAAGDSVRANWARRQRDLTDQVLVYPYLTSTPTEQRAEVRPELRIPEADSLYDKAVAIYKHVSLIPLAGALEANKRKAREALGMFKKILRDHPRSDKVDDAAFYCGEIYKEYLREDDPDDELAVRYYQWAVHLDPDTPHPARFQCAAVYDFRRHNRDKALELYHQVLDREENGNDSNCRFAATRIEQLTVEDFSHLRQQEPRERPAPPDPRLDSNQRGSPAPARADVPTPERSTARGRQTPDAAAMSSREQDEAEQPLEPDTSP